MKSVVGVRTNSKMSIALQLYASITAPGYKLTAKSVRLEFIQRAMKEHKLTYGCASTYHDNAKRKASGGQLYPPTTKPRKDVPSGTLPKDVMDFNSIWHVPISN